MKTDSIIIVDLNTKIFFDREFVLRGLICLVFVFFCHFSIYKLRLEIFSFLNDNIFFSLIEIFSFSIWNLLFFSIWNSLVIFCLFLNLWYFFIILKKKSLLARGHGTEYHSCFFKEMNEWTQHIRFHKKRMLANFEMSMRQSYDIFKSATP